VRAQMADGFSPRPRAWCRLRGRGAGAGVLDGPSDLGRRLGLGSS
jgi:hypothetical protein